MIIAIGFLACLALFLDLADRAPVIDDVSGSGAREQTACPQPLADTASLG